MTVQRWTDADMARAVEWLEHGNTVTSLADAWSVDRNVLDCRLRRYRRRLERYPHLASQPEARLSQDSLVEAWADLRAEPSAEVHGAERRLLLGCISDTHCGSKHFRADHLAQFIDRAYAKGVRHVVHAGDCVAGYHKKWRTELLCSSLDDQADIFVDSLPERDGLTYHVITGNHDAKAHQAAGVLPSAYFRHRFAEAGRTDVRFLGDNRARLELGGFTIGLQHPGSGGAENLEASVYRYLRKTPDWHGLDAYFCGHWHRYCRADRFGKHCWSLPCFESGGSVWGAGLAGDTDVGGLIVEVERDGRRRTVREELVLYG